VNDNDTLRPERVAGLAAHEIAHAWLEHRGEPADDMAAVALCQTWGVDTTAGYTDRTVKDDQLLFSRLVDKHGAKRAAELFAELFELNRDPWPAPHVVSCAEAVAARLAVGREQREEAARVQENVDTLRAAIGWFLNRATPPKGVREIKQWLMARPDVFREKRPPRPHELAARGTCLDKVRALAQRRQRINVNGKFFGFLCPIELPLPVLHQWFLQQVARVRDGKTRRATRSTEAPAAQRASKLAVPRAKALRFPPPAAGHTPRTKAPSAI
jgi:hypothetical protein